MTLFHIAIISIVQGLTEFLPISSSGHLVLVPLVMREPDQGLTMDLAVHIGTLLAVLVYYRRDIWEMILACFHWKTTTNKDAQRLAVYIVLATIPAVFFGFIMHKILPGGIRDVRVIAATTIGYGLLLGIVDHYRPQEKVLSQITLKSAMMIGFAQALALIPGTSRSGITMTAARSMGFNRVDAARFSFLLSLPATAGACLLAVLDVVKAGDVDLGVDMAIAAAMTFVAGMLAIAFMMRWFKNFGMMPFMIYRLLLGAGLLVYIFYGSPV